MASFYTLCDSVNHQIYRRLREVNEEFDKIHTGLTASDTQQSSLYTCKCVSACV